MKGSSAPERTMERLMVLGDGESCTYYRSVGKDILNVCVYGHQNHLLSNTSSRFTALSMS